MGGNTAANTKAHVASSMKTGRVVQAMFEQIPVVLPAVRLRLEATLKTRSIPDRHPIENRPHPYQGDESRNAVKEKRVPRAPLPGSAF